MFTLLPACPCTPACTATLGSIIPRLHSYLRAHLSRLALLPVCPCTPRLHCYLHAHYPMFVLLPVCPFIPARTAT